MNRAIEKLKEYAAEDAITAEGLAPFLAAVESGDRDAMKRNKDCIVQFTPCGYGIDDLYFELC